MQHRFIISGIGALVLTLSGLQSPTAWAADRYVNPHHSAAQDVGLGTAAMPYRTLTFAMSQLRPGDYLRIAAGVYREALIFPESVDWTGPQRTVIEGVGKVLIQGSMPVVGWTALGNGRYMRAWSKETAQVFVDGVSLQQIGGTLFSGNYSKQWWPGRKEGDQDSMPVGSFYYQKLGFESGNLYIRIAQPSLEGHVVEVSTLQHSLMGKNVANVTVRNLSFLHGNASPKDRNGLVLMRGHHIWLDRIHVDLADSIGIELEGDDNKLTNSSANNGGQLGLKARGSRVQLNNNQTNGNNTRGFWKWFEAGGAKFVGGGGLKDSVLIQHKAIGNIGDGVWFDWTNRTNRIERGVFAYNTGFGIHYESSHGGMIIDNVSVANGQRGIYLLHSANSVVAYNLVAGNKLQGIVVVDEGKRDPNFDMRPVNNKVFGNVVAWNKGALILPFDLFTNRSDANVFVGAPLDTFFNLGWWEFLANLTAWTARTKQDPNSQYINVPVDVGIRPTPDDGAAYIDWYKSFRLTTQPLVVDPALSKLLPAGRVRDGYAGPIL